MRWLYNHDWIGSDDGFAPGRCQAIIWTNAEILLIGPLGTSFSPILISIQTFPHKKMHLKVSSAKWRPFCLGVNVLALTPAQNDQHPTNWHSTAQVHPYKCIWRCTGIRVCVTHWVVINGVTRGMIADNVCPCGFVKSKVFLHLHAWGKKDTPW